MRPRAQLRTLALLSCIATAALSSPRPALAQDVDNVNVVAARQHFEKARAFYGQGSYREAVAELEAAHTLDPSAKDLVFNLGVVHEKLSDIDDALRWFQLYTTMSLTPQEHERADAYVRRLEGAKSELAEKTEAAEATTPAPAPSPGPDLPLPPPERPRHGRVDAATVAAVSLAGGALIFATVMGIKAESDRPPNGFTIGRDGSWTDFTDRTAAAHREAVAADIGFGASIVGGIVAGVLYVGRTRDTRSANSGQRPTVSVAPLVGGGSLIVGGSFR